MNGDPGWVAWLRHLLDLLRGTVHAAAATGRAGRDAWQWIHSGWAHAAAALIAIAVLAVLIGVPARHHRDDRTDDREDSRDPT